MPICNDHKIKRRPCLRLHCMICLQKDFRLKTRKRVQKPANPTTYVCILASACCKITEHTCADRCCGFGCMHWQQLCVEMTTGVNNAREQWPESAGLSPKNAPTKWNIPPCISTSLLNSCICTRRFVEIQFETVTIIEDCYSTDSPRQESLIIDKLSANQKKTPERLHKARKILRSAQI